MKRKVVHESVNWPRVNKNIFIYFLFVFCNCCRTWCLRFDGQLSDKNAVISDSDLENTHNLLTRFNFSDDQSIVNSYLDSIRAANSFYNDDDGDHAAYRDGVDRRNSRNSEIKKRSEELGQSVNSRNSRNVNFNRIDGDSSKNKYSARYRLQSFSKKSEVHSKIKQDIEQLVHETTKNEIITAEPNTINDESIISESTKENLQSANDIIKPSTVIDESGMEKTAQYNASINCHSEKCRRHFENFLKQFNTNEAQETEDFKLLFPSYSQISETDDYGKQNFEKEKVKFFDSLKQNFKNDTVQTLLKNINLALLKMDSNDTKTFSSFMRWPMKIYRCVQSLNLRRCMRIFMSRKISGAAEYIKETNATVKTLEDILSLPVSDDFDYTTNETDSELDRKVLQKLEEIAQFKNIEIDMGAGLVIELALDKSVNFRINFDTLVEARKKSKKTNYLKYLMIPAFVVAGMIPFVLPGLKMAVLMVTMINNFLFTTALVSLLRGIIFEKPVDKVVYINAGYDEHHEPHGHETYAEKSHGHSPPKKIIRVHEWLDADRSLKTRR